MQTYTLRIETKINSFLRKLKNLDMLSSETYSKLFSSGSSPGILYGLPKIHKPDFRDKFQFRPIFAAYNTPSYNLSKFLIQFLSPYSCNNYTVRNSYSFVHEICSRDDSDRCIMASFDVENLFTNIPLSETIQICLDYLFPNTDSLVFGLGRNFFKNLLDLSVLNSFFLFDGCLYKQIEGVGMGLPLGPTLANLFMSFHEKMWLDSCPPHFKPIYYRRYVDDTFVLFIVVLMLTNFWIILTASTQT